MKFTDDKKIYEKRRPNVWENGVIKNMNSNYRTS